MHGARLRTSIETRLQGAYANIKKKEYLNDMAGLLMDILELSTKTGGAPLLSTLDCRKADNFGELNTEVLKNSILSSSASKPWRG